MLAIFFTVLAYLFYKCLRMLANAVANETRMQHMGTVSSLHNTHSGSLLRLISAWSCLISLFLSNLD